MRVRDVMSPNVHTVAPNDTVGTARELFRRHRIDHLVVTQRKMVVGVAADRDLRDSPDDEKVGEVMVRRVTTIEPDATVRKAASLMTGHSIGSLPVVDDGHLVGILTESDLLRLLAKGAVHGERQVLPRRGPRRKPLAY
jgi:acetoin utilization protein AcuB